MKNFNGCTVHCNNDSWKINGKKLLKQEDGLLVVIRIQHSTR